jgi:hypothetical protein
VSARTFSEWKPADKSIDASARSGGERYPG